MLCALRTLSLISAISTRTQSVTEDLTKEDSPARGLATLGRGKYNQSAELKAGSSGHEKGEAHKPTTYARQC